jgi:hypothetical protein
MPRLIEIKTGNTLTITGPARVIVYGKPALSGTQPVPASDAALETAAKELPNGKSQPAHTGTHQATTHRPR